MKVTAIIPTMEKTKDYLKICVESLRKTVDWDIIVVSNGGEAYPLDVNGVTIRLHTRDQGQCRAVNIGASSASLDTDYLFIINDDMYFAPGWNEHLKFDHLCFSPNLVEPTDNNGSAPPFLKLDAGFTLDEFKSDLVDEFIANHESESDTTGFNFPVFIRGDVWYTISGYDEKYDPWGSNSDTDLQTKIELAGIQPMRLRDVLVYHFSNKSGTFDGSHQAEWQRNFDYYREKWGFTRDDDPKPDTWMATNLVNKEMNKFHPKWEGRYESTSHR